MDRKKLITYDGCDYFYENNNLYEDATKRKVSNQNYLFANNYGTKPYNILAIGNHVFFIYPDKVERVFTNLLIQDKQSEYFYTEGTGNEDGNDIYVFIRRKNSKKPALLGRSMQQITENVYKIGKFAYQIIDGKLQDMCPCTEFEAFSTLLEIQTGEPSCSKLIIYKKSSHGWKKIHENERGSLRSRNIDINF